jgi:hypothetical protein
VLQTGAPQPPRGVIGKSILIGFGSGALIEGRILVSAFLTEQSRAYFPRNAAVARFAESQYETAIMSIISCP